MCIKVGKWNKSTALILKMDISNIQLLNLLINRTVHTSTNKQTNKHTQIQKAAILATSNIIRKFTKLYEWNNQWHGWPAYVIIGVTLGVLLSEPQFHYIFNISKYVQMNVILCHTLIFNIKSNSVRTEYTFIRDSHITGLITVCKFMHLSTEYIRTGGMIDESLK